jgi:hypothetical protein
MIYSLPDYLDQHPLPAPSIELAVKDLLPRAKVEATIGDRHHDLAAYDLPLEVRVAVVSSYSLRAGSHQCDYGGRG